MTPLLIVKDHEELQSLLKQRRELEKFYEKRHNKDLHEEMDAASKDFWTKVGSYIKSKGIDINPEKEALTFRDGVLYHDEDRKDQGTSLIDFLKQLTGRK